LRSEKGRASASWSSCSASLQALPRRRPGSRAVGQSALLYSVTPALCRGPRGRAVRAHRFQQDPRRSRSAAQWPPAHGRGDGQGRKWPSYFLARDLGFLRHDGPDFSADHRAYAIGRYPSVRFQRPLCRSQTSEIGWLADAAALLPLPFRGEGWGEGECDVLSMPPLPDPLPASGERERCRANAGLHRNIVECPRPGR